MTKRLQKKHLQLYVKYFHLGVVFSENIWYNNPMYFKKLKKFFKNYL